MSHRRIPSFAVSFPALAFASALLWTAAAAGDRDPRNAYVQTNLVSDLPGMAKTLDPHLANPWGMAFSSTSPFWIANNHTGTSTLYNGQGQPFPPGNPLVVTIPPPKGGTPPSAPTGLVFNGTGGFLLDAGKPAVFIFASEDGTIAGWNPGVNPTEAVLKVEKSETVYKGLALAETDDGPRLYATNFFAGTVDVFDTHFAQVSVPGGFRDMDLPDGYAPFGIRNLRGKIYVTYALQDEEKKDDVAGPGHGFVDVFDVEGHLLRRLLSRGRLDSPWGLALAPPSFGAFGRALLVGNFGNGRINAYNPETGQLLGILRRTSSDEFVTIPGLWAIEFGNGANAGDPNVLFFTAGIPGPEGAIEDHGLFGSLMTAAEHEERERAD